MKGRGEFVGCLVSLRLSGQDEPARFVVDDGTWQWLSDTFGERRKGTKGRVCFDTTDGRRVVVDPAEVDRVHFLFEVVSPSNLPAPFREEGEGEDDGTGSAIAAWFRGDKGPSWIEGDLDTDTAGLARAALSSRRAFAGSTDSDGEPFVLNLANLQLLDVPLEP